MPLAFPGSRSRAGTGVVAPTSVGGTGATAGFGAVAAAAVFAVAGYKAARSRSPVGSSEWKSSKAEDGTIPEFEALLQQIAEKGLEPELRPEVWPLLLGVHGADETYEQRTVSYEGLRECLVSRLRLCQESEAACLEATARSRRSPRPSSSCGAPQHSTSAATSTTASPLYSRSPADAPCRPMTAAAAGDAAGSASACSGAADSQCELPSVPTRIWMSRASQSEDGSWGRASAAAVAAAAVGAAVGDWEVDGPGGGAVPAPTGTSFLGHVSRADVPPALRPYWKAQGAIAQDAVRVDFKKATLPGSTPLAAAGSSVGGGGGAATGSGSGLTLSLRGLGFTGLSSSSGGGGSGGCAAAAETPSASALSPAASTAAAQLLPGPGGDGGVGAAAASSGGLKSWLMEKYEGYRASRQQSMQPQQERDQQQQQRATQGQQQGEEQQPQELQELRKAPSGLPPSPLEERHAAATSTAAGAAGAPGGASAEQQRLGQPEQMQREHQQRELGQQEEEDEGIGAAVADVQGPEDNGSCGLVSEDVVGGVDGAPPEPLQSPPRAGALMHRIFSSGGGAGAPVAAPAKSAHASLSGAPPTAAPPLPSPPLAGGEAVPPQPARTKFLSSAFAAASAAFAAATSSSSRGATGSIIDDIDDITDGSIIDSAASPAAAPAASSPSAVSASVGDPRVGDDGSSASPVDASRVSSFFSFTTRMRQLASAPTLTLTTPCPPAASCSTSPLLQGPGLNLASTMSNQGHGAMGRGGHAGGGNGGQDCTPCTASASSVPSFNSTPRHTSEGGGAWQSFTQAHDAAAAGGGGATAGSSDGCAAAVTATAAAGGGSGRGCPAPAPAPVVVSAWVRTQLEQVTRFSPGQIRLVERLVSLLSAYAAHDPGLGYCQGMSDLALPFVLLLEDDVVAFWCFVRLMGKVRANFMPGPDGGFERLSALGSLLSRLDPPVGAHLASMAADKCHFALRMVLAQLRRELPPELAVRVWEQLWADDLLEKMAAEKMAAEAVRRGTEAGVPWCGTAGGVELREMSTAWRQRDGGEEAEAAQGCGAEGAFWNGGVAAASAALTEATDADGAEAARLLLEGGSDGAGGPTPACTLPAPPSCFDGADAVEGWVATSDDPNGLPLTHGSYHVAAAATHGTVQARPVAAMSYSEGVTNRVSMAAVDVSRLGLAPVLSCPDADAGADSAAAATTPATPAAVQEEDGSGGDLGAVCVIDAACVGTGPDRGLAALSIRAGATADGANPDAAEGPVAAPEAPTPSVAAIAAAAPSPACAASPSPPPLPPPAASFGRELFLYLVAAVVLSQRRRLLECREIDDVQRLFQSLSPLSRSDINDALRKAREYRDSVVPRQAVAAAAPSAPVAASPPPVPPRPAAAPAPTALVADAGRSAASPPERFWGRLLSARSDSQPAAKL